MCQPGMTLKKRTRGVYNKALGLQQFLLQSIRGSKPECGIGNQRAGTDVAELGATVVNRCDHADDVAALGLLEELAEVADDRAIWPPPYELQHV